MKLTYNEISPTDYILVNMPRPAMLEQLAEECAELGKAALKLARIQRGENPTPITPEEAKANLIEEAIDVKLCIELIAKQQIPAFDEISDSMTVYKIMRWADRVRK